MSKREDDTLCWNCSRSINGCCWARDFKPVPGWKAKPTKIKGFYEAGKITTVDSFHVIECPEFKDDVGERMTNANRARELGICERSYYRRKEREIRINKLLEIARKYFYEKDD